MLDTMSQGSSMRGLTQYISELRACGTRNAEQKRVNKEMAHIRLKFGPGARLDGYQRKKYVAKVLFTYLQGFKVDVGHTEAVQLMSSSKYSEKQIGYLAMTFLAHERTELMDQAIAYIRKDLADMNEVFTCLALHAVANMGSLAMAEALAEDVLKLLKKAALTLARIYQLYPEGVNIAEWSEHITRMIQNRHLGVSQSVTGLLSVLVKDAPQAYRSCYLPAVEQLYNIVIKEDYKEIYLYHDIPVPWLQVNLLRLLQLYPPPKDKAMLATLNGVLEDILHTSRKMTQTNIQLCNAYHAVLFEAIRLALHIDKGSLVVARVAALLGHFLTSRDTNVRYLSLETMAQLAMGLTSHEHIQMHQATILAALRDRDISVRRRALDVVYAMCSDHSAREIITHLLEYLPYADPSLREGIVLKVSILVERFATDYTWYIDTNCTLLHLGGNQVSDAVWHRVVQVVTNQPTVQEYAVAQAFRYLLVPNCHEALVKINAYLLGEFGDLIADRPGSRPMEQLQVLNERARLCSPATRVMLLTTYFKWTNLYPEIRAPLLQLLHAHQYGMNIEVQQRACEYVALVELNDAPLLELVCEEMPPYTLTHPPRILRAPATPPRTANPPAASMRQGLTPISEPLVSTPTKPHIVTANTNGSEIDLLDLRDWDSSSEQDADAQVPEVRAEDWSTVSLARDDDEERETDSLLELPAPPPLATIPRHSVSTEGGSSTPSYHGSEHTQPSAQEPLGKPPSARPCPIPGLAPPILQSALTWLGQPHGAPCPEAEPAPQSTPPASPAHTDADRVRSCSAAVLAFSGAQCLAPSQVLYQDATWHIAMTQEPLMLRIHNQSATPATVQALEAESVPGLRIALDTRPATLAAGATLVRPLEVHCDACFARGPSVQLTLAGQDTHQLRVPLPLSVARFLQPVAMQAADFFQRWKRMGPELETQRVFSIPAVQEADAAAGAAATLTAAGLAVLPEVDRVTANVVGAGVFRSTSSGPVACLVRYEPSAAAHLARLTVRTTQAAVSEALQNLLADALSG